MKKRKTKIQKGTLQPRFDEQLKFQVSDNILPVVQLGIYLKRNHPRKEKRVMGKVIVPPTSDKWKKLVENESVESWFSVFAKPKQE